jgi:hypothetical protein
MLLSAAPGSSMCRVDLLIDETESGGASTALGARSCAVPRVRSRGSLRIGLYLNWVGAGAATAERQLPLCQVAHPRADRRLSGRTSREPNVRFRSSRPASSHSAFHPLQPRGRRTGCPLSRSGATRLNGGYGRRADIRVHASSLPHAATFQLGASAPAATPPAGSPPPAAPVGRIQAPLTPPVHPPTPHSAHATSVSFGEARRVAVGAPSLLSTRLLRQATQTTDYDNTLANV